ncbi:hypothetical protein DRP04_12305 [Archaeoglobales archaeon]|nr:MAG: hypothetical protein DRP04_12305 [Archaeoglobales archaeon]
MPKPNLGKTGTIKKRTVYIYLPTEEMVEDWKKRAEKSGCSLSKFIIERVEDSIRKEEDGSYLTRLELINRIKKLEDENRKLREENKTLKLALQNLENELRRYRARPFLEEDFEGIRSFDRDLIELLRGAKRPVTDDEILAGLNIKPTEVELIKAISKQLERLEMYGLVEFTGRGWVWRG